MKDCKYLNRIHNYYEVGFFFVEKGVVRCLLYVRGTYTKKYIYYFLKYTIQQIYF